MRSALPWAVGGAVAAVALFLFRDAALGGRLPSDVTGAHDVSFVGTVLEQAAAQVRAGGVPLWFPEFDCGTPLAAAWMYGLLYPGLLLFALLPLGVAWAWTVALHLGWGAAGMTSFLRRRGCCAAGAAGGAVLFALSEWLVGRGTCGHLNLVLPVAWAPWVLRWIDGAVRGERAAVPALGVTLAAGMLAGHVQAWFYLGPLVLVFALAEARGASPDGFRGALPALRRLAVAAALALGISAAQAAITVEFLAGAAPVAEDPRVVHDVSAPPGLVLAKLLFSHLGDPPPAGELDPRPETRGIAGIWALALAAWGIFRRAPRRWVWAGAAVLAMVAATGLRTSVGTWIQDVPPFSFARAPGRFLMLAAVAVPVLAGHGISALPWPAAARAGTAALAGVLAVLLGTPPVVSTPDELHRFDLASALPPEVRGHRVHSPVVCQWVNLEKQGVWTLRTPCYVRTRGYADLVVSPSPALAYWFDLGAGLHPDLEWGEHGPVAIRNLGVERFRPMGRARFFGECVAGRTDAEVLAVLRRGERTLFVDGDDPGPDGTGTVAVASWTPDEVRLDVDATGPGWVLLSAKLYPGWTATVDGSPAEVRRGNLAFPAIRIPSAGRHAVVMEYAPASFRTGAAVSLVALAAALLLALRDRRVGSTG